jgi:hypothetical protein
MKSHGLTNTRTYRIWVQMRRRCRDPRASSFTHYGGRGIRVCDAWDASFEAFLADMGECPDGMSIERKKGDHGYNPDNCVWATIEEQNNNRSTVELIEHDGKRLSLKQWSREIGVNYQTLVSRRRKGLRGTELFAPNQFKRGVRNTKPTKKQVPVQVNGDTKSVRQAALDAGLKYTTVYRRLRAGYSIEDALSLESFKTGETL